VNFAARHAVKSRQYREHLDRRLEHLDELTALSRVKSVLPARIAGHEKARSRSSSEGKLDSRKWLATLALLPEISSVTETKPEAPTKVSDAIISAVRQRGMTLA